MPGTPKKRAKKAAQSITKVTAPVIDTQTAAQRAAYRLEREQLEWERLQDLPKGPVALRALPVDDELVAEAVMGMTWAGLRPDRIAQAMGMTLEELMLRYGAQIQSGSDVMLGQVAGRLVRNALMGDTPAAKFIMEAQGGWSSRTSLGVETEQEREASLDERRGIVDRIIQHVDRIKREALMQPEKVEDADFKDIDPRDK